VGGGGGVCGGVGGGVVGGGGGVGGVWVCCWVGGWGFCVCVELCVLVGGFSFSNPPRPDRGTPPQTLPFPFGDTAPQREKAKKAKVNEVAVALKKPTPGKRDGNLGRRQCRGSGSETSRSPQAGREPKENCS